MGEYAQAYQHVLKLGDDGVRDILVGKVYIFAKLDGTNSVLWKTDTVNGGSRRRVLKVDKDNAGFYNEEAGKDCYANFFAAHPDLVLWGEWLVPHTIKNYRKDAWRKFYVFDVGTVDENGVKHYLPYDTYQPWMEEFGIEYLAPLKIITNPSVEDIIFTAENNFYLMEDGQIGEGVVCKNYDFVNQFGETVWAKLVRNEFKERHYKTMGAPESEKSFLEEKIAQEYATGAFVEKEYDRFVKSIEEDWNSRMIPRLLNTIWHTFVEEEIWNTIQKYKNPTIDFKLLKYFVTIEIKKGLPQIF